MMERQRTSIEHESANDVAGAPPRPRVGPARSIAASDGGFTMIEIIVVMIIVAILVGIAAVRMQTARDNARIKTVIASAGAYSNAIAAFQLEHGNRVPVMGSNDWPTATRTLGPVDLYGQRYMKGGPPEAVQSGMTNVGNSAASARGSHGGLVYVASGSGYRIEVWVKKNETWMLECQTGPLAPAGSAC